MLTTPHPPPRNCSFWNRKERGMWQVSEGGGRCQGGCWGPHGGLEGPRRSQRPCRNAAAGAQASRAHPARAEASGAVGVRPGDHGFRLHSGQSFPGTPGRPGNRTGTRPAGGTGSVRAPQGRHPPQPGVSPLYGLTLHPNALPRLRLKIMYIL